MGHGRHRVHRLRVRSRTFRRPSYAISCKAILGTPASSAALWIISRSMNRKSTILATSAAISQPWLAICLETVITPVPLDHYFLEYRLWGWAKIMRPCAVCSTLVTVTSRL